MEQKIELLQALMYLPMEEDQSNYLSECCLVAQTAMRCLYQSQQGKEILLVRSMDTALIQRGKDNEEAWRLQECTNLFTGRNGLNYWQTP